MVSSWVCWWAPLYVSSFLKGAFSSLPLLNWLDHSNKFFQDLWNCRVHGLIHGAILRQVLQDELHYLGNFIRQSLNTCVNDPFRDAFLKSIMRNQLIVSMIFSATRS